MFYNVNGIPTSEPPAEKFWLLQFGTEIGFKEGDITGDIDIRCVQLRNQLAARIFGSLENYYNLLPAVSMLYPYAGIDAELNVSKTTLAAHLQAQSGNELSNKLLYFYDCANLLGTLQNAVLESKYLIGQFYRVLNENTFLINNNVVLMGDGLIYGTGQIVTNITALTNHLFVNLYSQLDFICKFIFELEHLAVDFIAYPKLKSSAVLFGDAKRLSLHNLEGSLLDMSENIKRIISLRNEIVHNSSIDSMPKVYILIDNAQIVEKYILLPDFENGFIAKYKNRNRFFHDNMKLNEVLPSWIIEFWQRLQVTLNAIGI